jgi:hypothetical protein
MGEQMMAQQALFYCISLELSFCSRIARLSHRSAMPLRNGRSMAL